MLGEHTRKSWRNWLKRERLLKILRINIVIKFSTVNEEVVCCCPNRHSPGCGCMSDAFIAQTRNNLSSVLSESDSAEDFIEKLLILN